MKVSRTRIQILVLETLKRITFLCGKLRKDDKFLGMSLGTSLGIYHHSFVFHMRILYSRAVVDIVSQ